MGEIMNRVIKSGHLNKHSQYLCETYKANLTAMINTLTSYSDVIDIPHVPGRYYSYFIFIRNALCVLLIYTSKNYSQISN